MPQLSIYGKLITSVFQLLGTNENDISYSIGWALSQSPSFLQVFIKAVTGQTYVFDELVIRLQAHQSGRGFTDFELELIGEFYLIIEAKKGWIYPTEDQLRKYVERKDFKESPATIKKMVVFTDCSPDYSEAFFTHKELDSYPVDVLAYRQLYELIQQASPNGSNAEKRLLTDLLTYLKPLITMQDKTSNMAWVVSLGDGTTTFSALNFKEIVEQKKIYFHPVGSNYRKEPPNYIAFRFDGKLQAIHHVDAYKVVKNAADMGVGFQDQLLESAYFVYTLGKAIPCQQIPKGPQIVMANRVECMLDTLLTSPTISDALNTTRERLRELTTNK